MAFQYVRQILAITLASLIPVASYAASDSNNAIANGSGGFTVGWAYSANPFAGSDELCGRAAEDTNKKMHDHCAPRSVASIDFIQEIVKFAPPGWVCLVLTKFTCSDAYPAP